MSKIFLSHSSRDGAAALAVAKWLDENGWSDYFLDFSQEQGLAPGERWQEALKRAADRCEAVLFLISPAWRDSRWCLAEFLLAKQLGKAIFGVLVEATPLDSLPPEMISEWQLTNLVNGVERRRFRVELDAVVPPTELSFAAAGLQRLKQGLQRAGLDPSSFTWPPASDPDRAPYRGLSAMDRDDAAVFFGRDASITLGLDALRRLRQGGIERLFVILGASGSGKSSFLRAGLLPRLARDDRHFLVIPPLRPERAAVNGPTGLVACLEGAFRELGQERSRADLRNLVSRPSSLLVAMDELQAAAHSRLPSESSLAPTCVLPIDQAEELFGSDGRREAEQLLSLLSEMLGGAVPELRPSKPLVLLAIRSDSYERLQIHPSLGQLTQFVFNLPPLPREELKSVIEGPAARHTAAGRQMVIDPQLTQKLLADTEGADALPLLAFTLQRLLVEYGGRGRLALGDYEALGGVAGSIDAAIEAAFAEPRSEPPIPDNPAELHSLLRRAFIPWLARVDPDTEERKRRIARWDEIPPESYPVLERMLKQRLLVRDRREVPGTRVDSVVIEVAHEALLRRWRLLSTWLDQDADALKAIDATKRAAAEWRRRERREAWLDHTGERLRFVESLLERSDLDRLLGEEGRAYLRACRKRDDDEVAEEAAQQRMIEEASQATERARLSQAEAEAKRASERAEAARRLSLRTTLAALVAVVFMVAAIWEAFSANTQQKTAEHALGASSLAAADRHSRDGQVAQSVAYLARAVRIDPTHDVWRGALASALIMNRWPRRIADLPSIEPTTAATFSPDGRFLLTIAGDDAHLWSAETGAPVGRRMRHRNSINTARFSRDGRLIATASVDRSVGLWDGGTGEALGKPLRLPESVHSVEFTSEAARVVANTEWRTNILEVVAGAELRLAAGNLERVDGRFVVAYSEKDSGYRLWSAEQGSFVGVTITGKVLSKKVAFDTDESRVVVPTTESVHVLETSDGSYVLPPLDLPKGKFQFILGEGGRHLGIRHSDNKLIVLDLATRKVVGPAIDIGRGAEKPVISRDGLRVVAASEAPSAKVEVWDATSGASLAKMEYSARARIVRCKGGSRFATVAGRQAHLWELETGDVKQLGEQAETISKAVFSGECALLATAAGGEVRVFDVKSGAPLFEPLVHEGKVADVAFDPERRRLATVSPAGGSLWDLHSGVAQGEAIQPSGKLDSVAFSRDGSLAITARESTIRAWDTRTGRQVGPDIVAGGTVDSVQVDSESGLVFASSSDAYHEPRQRTVQFWRMRDGVPHGRPMRFPEDSVFELSPQWKSLVSLHDKAARIWSVDTGERVGKLIRHREVINSLSFSRDGRIIASASDDKTARVWSAESGEPVSAPLRHDGGVQFAGLSDDGARVVTIETEMISDEERQYSTPHPRIVRIWDARSSKQLGESLIHQMDVNAAAISPDGSLVLTASGSISRLWDAATATAAAAPLRHESPVTSVAFSGDRTRFLTVSGTSVHLWSEEDQTRIGAPLSHENPVASAAFVPSAQRVLTQENASDSSPVTRAWLWDAPTLTREAAQALAAAAEILSGYRVSDLGAIEPSRGSWRSAAEQLGTEEPESPPDRSSQAFVRWLFSDPSTRARSPFASTAAESAAPDMARILPPPSFSAHASNAADGSR